jgi:hypothetical protein
MDAVELYLFHVNRRPISMCLAVPLTKVKKKSKDWKGGLIDQIHQCIEE